MNVVERAIISLNKAADDLNAVPMRFRRHNIMGPALSVEAMRAEVAHLGGLLEAIRAIPTVDDEV